MRLGDWSLESKNREKSKEKLRFSAELKVFLVTHMA